MVAKGFTQHPRLDYHSTFSPVVKHATVHLGLTIATQLDCMFISWMLTMSSCKVLLLKQYTCDSHLDLKTMGILFMYVVFRRQFIVSKRRLVFGSLNSKTISLLWVLISHILIPHFSLCINVGLLCIF